MKVNYLNYKQDLFQEAIDNKEPVVYVFDNHHNRLRAREYYKRPFLKQESIFLTVAELKEKLFPADRLVLKEEKLAVIFYELLTEEEKRKLKIDSYFDAIELAAEFFNFYAELNEYNIGRLEGLRDWQQQKYNILQGIRERYLARMEELNYTDRTLAFNFNNLSLDYLNGYRKVVFVNIVNFTPKEKELLERLELAGMKVELYLQLAPQDFDEGNLSLKSVSLPADPGTAIRLYHTGDDLLQLINLIIRCGQDCTILDADYDNSNYHRLLSPDKIIIDKEISFSETKIFRFLNNLYRLYVNTGQRGHYLILPVNDLLEACYLREFRDYYSLTGYNLRALQELARSGYVYFSPELTRDHRGPALAGFGTIMEDIKKINGMRTLKEFCSFLEGVNLRKLNDYWLVDNVSQYFDALLELSSIEEMGIVSSWNRYFDDTARGLFRMILNYLRYKKVKPVKNGEGEGVRLDNLLTACHDKRERVIILNASRGVIPSEREGGFLLTEKQRLALGLRTYSDRRLEEKYYFFRHLFSSKEGIVFSLKNLEGNVTSSSFVDELKIEYGLEISEMEVRAVHYPAVISRIFSPEHLSTAYRPAPDSIRADNLVIEREDFPEGVFTLGYYKYNTLKDCYYRFYLEHIAGLEEERLLIKKELDPVVIGNFVHEIFTELINRTGVSLQVDRSLVEEVVEERFNSYDLRIDDYYKRYYRDVLLKKIKESVLYFFGLMRKRVKEGIKSIRVEWQPENGPDSVFFRHRMVDLYLNGRIDLIIDTGERKYIVDFKTGGSSTDQLDFYSLLLNPDLVKDYRIEKGIYSVMEERYIPGRPGTEFDFAAELSDNIEGLFSSGEYGAEYRSRCKRCIFLDICRVVMG